MGIQSSIIILCSISWSVIVAGCASNGVSIPKENPKIYEIDQSSRRSAPFVTRDKKNFEIRFENADLLTIVDQLNRLQDVFSVVCCASNISTDNNLSTSEGVESPGQNAGDGAAAGSAATASAATVSGYFSGNFQQIIKDVCLTGGFVFDRIDDHFYIGSSPVDLSLCASSTVLETSLTSEELNALRSSFGSDVDFSLVSSKLLITGRFYAVKRFSEYVEKLNEVKRSYVARLVFVRLERSRIARLEAELKASPLDLISQGYDLYAMFESQLDVKFSRDRSYNYSEQLIYCTDGQKSTLKIGSSFERESRSVSDYGTSTVSGYQSFEDGVDIEITPRRSLNGVVELALKFGNSKFNDVSTLSKNQVDLSYDSLTLLENRLYFVASLNEQTLSGGSKILGLSSSQDDKVLTCWLCVSPVQSVKPFDANERF